MTLGLPRVPIDLTLEVIHFVEHVDVLPHLMTQMRSITVTDVIFTQIIETFAQFL